MAKGGAFEREVCKKISEWWTLGKRDDLFWRTSNSGGRATVRRKKGKYSYSGHGDLSYTHPKGKKLLDLISFELKRGYNQNAKKGKNSPSSFQSLVDAPKHLLAQPFEEWIFQAEQAAKNARAKFWCLIHRPDKRRDMVYMSYSHATLLFGVGAERPIENVMDRYVSVVLRFNKKIPQLNCNRIFGMRFDSWLSVIQPDAIRKTLSFIKGNKS